MIVKCNNEKKVILHLVSKGIRSTEENVISADVCVCFKFHFIWGTKVSSEDCVPHRIGEAPISSRRGSKISCYSSFEFSEKYLIHWASVFLLGDVSMGSCWFQEIWVFPVISGTRRGSCRNYIGLSISLFDVFTAVGLIPKGINSEKL